MMKKEYLSPIFEFQRVRFIGDALTHSLPEETEPSQGNVNPDPTAGGDDF